MIILICVNIGLKFHYRYGNDSPEMGHFSVAAVDQARNVKATPISDNYILSAIQAPRCLIGYSYGV